MPVIVHTSKHGDVGLVVERIIDIVPASLKVQHAATRQGALATILLQDRVTELLDMDWIVATGRSRRSELPATASRSTAPDGV